MPYRNKVFRPVWKNAIQNSLSRSTDTIEGSGDVHRLGVVGDRTLSEMATICQFSYILHLHDPQNGSETHFCVCPWKYTIWSYFGHRFIFTKLGLSFRMGTNVQNSNRREYTVYPIIDAYIYFYKANDMCENRWYRSPPSEILPTRSLCFE